MLTTASLEHQLFLYILCLEKFGIKIKFFIILLLYSGQDTLIMMTREFDPITEKPLHPEEFGEGGFQRMCRVW